MKYYLTTPIYYVNAAPHIGHAYTTIVADLIKRFKRMQGYDAVLTTGSDEHGVNVERAAERTGKTPQEFCDVIAAEFRKQWQLLGLDIDYFQRTTDPKHARSGAGFVQALPPKRLYLQGFVHRPILHLRQSLRQRRQAGRSLSRLRAAHRNRHGRELFLQAFGFTDRLLELYESRPDFIQPESRRNEVLSFVTPRADRSVDYPHKYQVGHSGGGGSAARFLRVVRCADRL